VAGGDSMTIRGNYIGGNAPQAQGVWVSNAATASNGQRIIGIQSSAGTTIPTLIDSNVITGFNLVNTNTTGTAGAGIFTGIYITGGNANVGVNGGNLIGSMNSNDAIVVAAPFTAAISATTPSFGLNAISANTTATSNIVVANNSIGGLTTTGIGATQNGKIVGVFNALATIRISKNIIGGTTANSISCGTAGATSGIGEMYGIRNNAASQCVITGNTIQNLSQMGNRVAVSPVDAILITGANTTTTRDSIINNTIANILTHRPTDRRL
jgi:hypothetical protein